MWTLLSYSLCVWIFQPSHIIEWLRRIVKGDLSAESLGWQWQNLPVLKRYAQQGHVVLRTFLTITFLETVLQLAQRIKGACHVL